MRRTGRKWLLLGSLAIALGGVAVAADIVLFRASLGSPLVMDAIPVLRIVGTAQWVVPTVALCLFGALAGRLLARSADARRMFGTAAIRLASLLCATSLASVTASLLKRLLGRARPSLVSAPDPFTFRPLAGDGLHVSLPSHEAAVAVAAAMAISLLWPRASVVAWAYAAFIGAARVLVLAHHPSDVVAAAALGLGCALLVHAAFTRFRPGFAGRS